MSIVLLILKIIGFVLLGILALLLLILLLLLFVPIRYQVNAEYKDDGGPFADVRFSYLFPVVRGFVKVGEKEGNKTSGVSGGPAMSGIGSPEEDAPKGHAKIPMEGGVKVLFFTVVNFFPSEEEKAASAEKKAKKEAKKAEKEAKKKAKEAAKEARKAKGKNGVVSTSDDTGTVQTSDLSAAPLTDEDFKDGKTSQSGGAGTTGDGDWEDEEKDDDLTLIDKIRIFLLKLPDVFTVIFDKLFGIPDLLANLWEKASDGTKNAVKKGKAYKKFAQRMICIWEKPYTKEALRKAKRAILRILKGICPRKGHVHVTAGMEDVAVTGQLCGYYGILVGMFYPFIGKRVVFEPDFDEKRYEGEAFLKGRFRLCSCLDALWLFFFDKDIKRLKKAYEKAKSELDTNLYD